MGDKDRLSKLDWIKAGYRGLAKGGAGALRAEALARDLKVSKGSFYWHFKDVPAFKTGVLSHWEVAATDEIIEALEAQAMPAFDTLCLLIEHAVEMPDGEYGGPQVLAAIREWARYDNQAAEVVKSAEKRRIAYVTDLFKRAGQTAEMAEVNARLLYAGLLGLEHLALMGHADLKADMMVLLKRLIAVP
ncbi:TetR family transcriptional regulator [Roseibium sp. TrichSKD4]|uniref:TetR/AcrR family transcriptional regulator n=1 Tax=Roseibium sp. TrichSKD4 TaxID=744980 RepID=UPI0001E56695|nr:TetR/AcrR family transcriptional regulator [Roseibium sp. TrichSKD4]EFO32780.1 TetR family transcriptional regulator [Roseibium sp. TrichSKD4]